MSMLNNHQSRSQNDPQNNPLPNQNNAIHHSKHYSHLNPNKPVSLAHFMGARPDLNGPVLTKRRVDEKELKPDGWELAERRFEILSKQAQHLSPFSSLPSLLSPASASASASALASHAANSSKRALPGMVTSLSSDLKPSSKSFPDPASAALPPSAPPPTGFDKHKQRSLPIPPPSLPASSNSHAATYLKPKSLADRLALLGVATDVQPIKSHSPQTAPVSLGNSPQVDKFQTGQILQASDKPPTHSQRVTKSKSTFSLRPAEPPAIDFEQHNLHRPLSSYMPSPRPLPSPKAQSPATTHPSRQPFSIRDNAQPALTHKKNPRSHSNIQSHSPQPAPTDPTISTLAQPNKLPTASLSRLAGSNIVAQRLQWSKEKEQLGTMDEFGTPSARPSPSPAAGGLHQNQNQIPSPVFPTGLATGRSGFVDLSSKTGPERELDSAGSTTAPHRPHHPRYHSSHPDSHKLGSQQAHTHKAARRSSDEDSAQWPCSAGAPPETKRNKKNTDSPERPGAGVAKKPGAIAPVDTRTTSPPLRSPNKHRLRGPHRAVPPSQTTRGELPKPPSSSSTLPSLASFEPAIAVKKATFERAAVWENQLVLGKKATSLAEGPANNRPLPVPPVCVAPARQKVGQAGSCELATEARPLPVVPAMAKTCLEARPQARPVARVSEQPAIGGRVGPVDVKQLLAKHKEWCSRLSNLSDGKPQVEMFQLNRTASDELCTTMVDAEDYGTFYSQEILLVVFTMPMTGKVVVVVWTGREATMGSEVEEDRILRMYGGPRRAQVVSVRQGHEPYGLVQGLGGRLVVKTGDRFDSVYQRTNKGVFVCKRFGEVVVIEEAAFKQESLCTGYCVLVKVCEEGLGKSKLSLYVWKGNEACSKEIEECRIFAMRMKSEAIGVLSEVIEVDEGSEPESFVKLFCSTKNNFIGSGSGIGGIGGGQGLLEDYARSYYWKKYKSLIPIEPMVVSLTGQRFNKISHSEISLIYTGLEVFLVFPNSFKKVFDDGDGDDELERFEEACRFAKEVGDGIGYCYSSSSSSDDDDQGVSGEKARRRKVNVNCLVFPSLVPVDLRGAVRFGYEFDALNEVLTSGKAGTGVGVGKMNLMSLDECFEVGFDLRKLL